MGDFMAEVVKIVLTGGPCGGKTSALKYISEELKKLNIPTITIGEVASRLFSEGKTPENVGSYEFHRELFEIQLAEENEKTQIAKNMDCEKEYNRVCREYELKGGDSMELLQAYLDKYPDSRHKNRVLSLIASAYFMEGKSRRPLPCSGRVIWRLCLIGKR